MPETLPRVFDPKRHSSRSEQSITAEYMVRAVKTGPTRLASPGYPVKRAERGGLAGSMEAIAGVYMGRSDPRSGEGEGGGSMFDVKTGRSGEESKRW